MSAVAVETPVEPWELHSELVLVCPEVFTRALELLPERDPDTFLSRPRPPRVLRAEPVEVAPPLAGVAFRYALWRLGQTARSASIVTGALVVLASLAEVLH
jgi:hypothetical protein